MDISMSSLRSPINFWTFQILEAVVQRCSVKKMFRETSQNSQENTCARVSLLNKVAGPIGVLRNFAKSQRCRPIRNFFHVQFAKFVRTFFSHNISDYCVFLPITGEKKLAEKVKDSPVLCDKSAKGYKVLRKSFSKQCGKIHRERSKMEFCFK